jgi:hypothetical protein
MKVSEVFFLLAAHGVCDYPLQGDFLARGKNHKNPLPGIPWWQCLFWHAMIHAGAVLLITGNPFLGIAELAAHLVIDYGKCDGWFGFNTDQVLHVSCKLIWVSL